MENKITISKEILETHGYNRWTKAGDVSCPEHLNGKWQKAIRDDDGNKRYFINIDESFGWNPREKNGEQFHNWWPSIQFEIEVPGFGFNSIEISFVQWLNESGQYSGITVQTVEEMAEDFFTKLHGKNYE